MLREFIGGLWPKRPTSVLGQQLSATLRPGMIVPEPFELLFRLIEAQGFYMDLPRERMGFLFSDHEMRRGWTDQGRPGGTDISFTAYERDWLCGYFDPPHQDIIARLCVFARSGEGSMAAFWLADDGSQKIVHLGSGTGSDMICLLCDDPVDFLRLIAIGYDEICWGEYFDDPPNSDGEFIVEPNLPFRQWVVETFGVTIPERASEIVRHPAYMTDKDSPDPFWRWLQSRDR